MEASNEIATNALETIKKNYMKILVVNLTTRTYIPIVLPEDEKRIWEEPSICFKNNIDKYFEWFKNSIFLYNDDRIHFMNFTSDIRPDANIIYRRIRNGECFYVYMDIKKTSNYTDDNQECVLYVRDIDTTFKRESLKVEENAKRYDSTTGLLNHKAFEDDIKKKLKGNIGVAFLDINGLKYTNDNVGHNEGDKLILKAVKYLKDYFPAYSIYRTGGDEFVVIGFNVKTRTFLHTVTAFHKRVWNDTDTYTIVKDKSFPMLSVGYSADVCDDIREIIEDAEAQMYEDKSVFYDKFPELKR